MTRSELLKRLGECYPNLKPSDVAKLVDIFFEQLAVALVKGDRIELRRFATLSLRERDSRRARNPRTNQVVNLGKRYVTYFRASKESKARINKEPVV